jgi:hypothetical protein
MWRLTIEWELDDQPVVGTFASLQDVMKVLNKYTGYSVVEIQFLAFNDPDRL